MKTLEDFMTEGLKDSKKVDRSTLESNASQTLDAFEKAGFKVKYDPDKSVGEAISDGEKFKFSIGGENLNLDLQLFFKHAPTEAAKAIKALLKASRNYS